MEGRRKDMKDTLNLALIQMACGADVDSNVRHASDMARQAKESGAELICLQELFNNVYFPAYVDSKYYRLAEPIPGPTSDALSALAKELDVVLVGSIYEYVQDGLYFNTAVVFERDGTLLGKSRKMHIPEADGYTEKLYFAPGDTDYPLYRTSLVNLAVATCWDQWFPEVARIAMLKGAELILYPTAIGNEPSHPEVSHLDRWQTVQRGHAVANAMYVAACNRVGKEDRHVFFGGSFVADPDGRLVAEADHQEQVLLATLERNKIRAAREVTPFCRDRRVDTYAPLLKRSLVE
jgi:N-carbamoylputrescine amidase